MPHSRARIFFWPNILASLEVTYFFWNSHFIFIFWHKNHFNRSFYPLTFVIKRLNDADVIFWALLVCYWFVCKNNRGKVCIKFIILGLNNEIFYVVQTQLKAWWPLNVWSTCWVSGQSKAPYWILISTLHTGHYSSFNWLELPIGNFKVGVLYYICLKRLELLFFEHSFNRSKRWHTVVPSCIPLL